MRKCGCGLERHTSRLEKCGAALGQYGTESKKYGTALAQYGPAAAVVVGGILLWEAAVRFWQIPGFILPAPSQVARTLWQWREPLLLEHLPATVGEVALGLGASLVAGVSLAVLMHVWPPLQRSLYPIVVGIQTIPVIAISPLFLFWFGYSLGQKVAVVVIVAFFPILVGTVDGLRSADPALTTWLRAAGVGPWQMLRLAEIPAALPSFFSGLKVAATASVVGAVIGEWLGGEAGLGVYGRRAASAFKAPELFASVVLLAALGALLFLLVVALERRFTRWQRLGQPPGHRPVPDQPVPDQPVPDQVGRRQQGRMATQ